MSVADQIQDHQERCQPHLLRLRMLARGNDEPALAAAQAGQATSAILTEVEAAIQEQLYNLMAGKTVIAIAHRLSTIAALDRLVVIDKGRIVEEGGHAMLLQRGGLYADLWSRQSGGFLARDAAA